MQSHTNHVLLTSMPRNDASWLQHPCLLLIFREAFQNPSLLNKNMKQLLILEERKQKSALNISAICTSFWSHSSTVFVVNACERRKQTWSTDVFVKWHVLIPLPQSNGNLWIIAISAPPPCFNLKKKILYWIKPTQNNFYSFEIFKRIPAHTVYKKEDKQI